MTTIHAVEGIRNKTEIFKGVLHSLWYMHCKSMDYFSQNSRLIPFKNIKKYRNYRRLSSKYRPIFTALKIQAKTVILQEIQELQRAMPRNYIPYVLIAFFVKRRGVTRSHLECQIVHLERQLIVICRHETKYYHNKHGDYHHSEQAGHFSTPVHFPGL